MKKTGLTFRQKEIITLLIDSKIKKPITIKEIAKKLSVSSRTISREIPKIEKWIDENEVEFIHKQGIGLFINENLEKLNLIKELLERENVKPQYSKKERVNIILRELLESKYPLKLYYFTKVLNVSEGTLSNDLDEVENWLKEYKIEVIRKTGFGIFINSDEENIRKALIELFYDELNKKDIVKAINEVRKLNNEHKSYMKKSINNRLLKFINKETINKVIDSVSKVQKNMKIILEDNDYIRLIIHLAFLVKRIESGEEIKMDKEIIEKLSKEREFNIAEQIANSIEKNFNIEIPKDEFGYITMHLKGIRLNLEKEDKDYLNNLNSRNLAIKMIEIAEKGFKLNLRKDDNLVESLANHLGFVINRLTMNFNIRNPMIDDIKRYYKSVFEVSKKSCVVLEELLNKSIPESEIAYITMHFAAAIERLNYSNPINVVVACPTGIGTSRLLATKLKKYFANINVLGTISTIQIEKSDLEGVDLIISTVDITYSKCRNICVNPLLLKEDRKLIEKEISYINRNYRINRREIKEKSERNIENKRLDVERITLYGEKVLSITKKLKVEIDLKVKDTNDILKFCSEYFSETEEEKVSIYDGLKKREEIGSTVLEDSGIALLHCKTSNLNDIKFGILNFDKSYKNNRGNTIQGVLVIVIPSDIDKYDLEIVNQLSIALVEDDKFSRIIKSKNKEDIKNYVEYILSKFYYKKIKKFIKESEFNEG